MLIRILLVVAMMGVWTLSGLALGADAPFALTIHNNKIEPEEMDLPAGIRVRLVIHNQENLPFEFESYDLSRELVVPKHTDHALYVGPLVPGNYHFFNDFNHEMQGLIVVRSNGMKAN